MNVGSQALISHTYEANNGNLARSDYGNGDYYEPAYDAIDRLHSVSYNGVESFNWEYGADGRVGLHNDLVNDVTWMYEYADDGSLISAVGDNGERFVYTYEPSTGKLLTRTVFFDSTVTKTTTYNYSDHANGEKANLIDSVVLPIGTVSYDYDGFYRASYDVEVGGSDILTTDYTFRSGSAANSTSLMVESMTNAGNGWSEALSYTYDANGNIETIRQNGTLKATYYYDSLNQLIREDNAWLNKTITYTYDNGGNILSCKEYAYTTGSLSGLTATSTGSYVYGDNNWKDKLTGYNGSTITYDAIGNPLSYYNGYTFDWQKGRQLAGVTGNGKTISYTYNSDGIRTSKTVNGVTTEYTLDSSNVVVETNGTDTLWFYYDASGSLTGFELNGTAYFYVKNMQGDIVAIVNSSGTKVVEYLYDSWGKLISTTGSLASTVGAKNPYRYRGYRYDTETGLYYLQSRYYDPAVKRFINADSLSMIGANRDFASLNLFAYCGNNPDSRKDIGGYAWETIFDIVSLATSVAEVIARPADPWAWAGLIGDVVDVVVPFVGGLGESVDVAKTMFRVVDKGDDIVSAARDMRRAAKATDDIKSSTGAYVILYEGGQHYIGKGGFGRAIKSATQHSSSNNKVTSIIWAPTPSRRSAFVTEFLLQSTFGLNKKYEKSFNLIWSPGKTILREIQ